MRHPDALPDRDAVRPGVLFVRADGTVAHELMPASYRQMLTAEDLKAGFAKAVTSP
jgi:hypothetical protein